jgi:sodium-dependent dicarboxylate transporter 2/3/5
MAALEGTHPLSFVAWMAFALPLTVLLLVAMVGFLAWRHGAGGRLEAPSPPPPLHPGAGRMLAVGAAMIAAWLTEPLHGVSAPGVALLGTAVLFGTGMLGREDLGRIDWGTLMLIAGGLVMGRALEQAGCIASFAGMVDWPALPPTERLAMLVLASATLSALLSNTATATILIPVGLAVLPGPATPVMIALGCSLGAPFVISTPPNAMVHGEGGITAGDLLWPGMLLLLGGGALLVLSGPRTLGIFGLS